MLRAGDHDHLGSDDVRPRVGRPVDPERFLVGRGRADHAQPAVVIDVGRLQPHAGELTHQVRFFRGQAGAAEHREGIRPVRRLNPFDLLGYPLDRLLIGERAEPTRRGRIPLISLEQPIGMGALQIAFDPLGTKHALVERNSSPGLKADYLVVFDLSWMPHCIPQKQQWVCTNLSGSTADSRRNPFE